MRIRLKRSILFVDRKDVNTRQREVRIPASTESQVAPDWIENDPIFDLLVDDGSLEVIGSPAPKKFGAYGSSPAGLFQGTQSGKSESADDSGDPEARARASAQAAKDAETAAAARKAELATLAKQQEAQAAKDAAAAKGAAPAATAPTAIDTGKK